MLARDFFKIAILKFIFFENCKTSTSYGHKTKPIKHDTCAKFEFGLSELNVVYCIRLYCIILLSVVFYFNAFCSFAVNFVIFIACGLRCY